MFRIGSEKKMTPRPDNEPAFDSKNKLDRRIVLLVAISLVVIAILVAVVVILYESKIWAS